MRVLRFLRAVACPLAGRQFGLRVPGMYSACGFALFADGCLSAGRASVWFAGCRECIRRAGLRFLRAGACPLAGRQFGLPGAGNVFGVRVCAFCGRLLVRWPGVSLVCRVSGMYSACGFALFAGGCLSAGRASVRFAGCRECARRTTVSAVGKGLCGMQGEPANGKGRGREEGKKGRGRLDTGGACCNATIRPDPDPAGVGDGYFRPVDPLPDGGWYRIGAL